MVREPVHVIVNPAAGGGRGRRARALVEAALGRRGFRFRVHETGGRGDAVDLARRSLDAGAGAILSVGGDGTAHEVANGLLSEAGGGALPAMGVVPVGTGNDFARMLGVSRSAPVDGLERLERRYLDAGKLEWEGGAEYFINGSGTGIDVEVVRQIERLPRIPGFASYLIGVLRALAAFRAIPVRVRLDGEARSENVMIVAVMNGDRQAGGFHVCPGALPHDGRLDVCLVRELGMVGSLRVLPRVLRGTHVGHAAVAMARAGAIDIESSSGAPLFFQVDGELRTPDTRWLRYSVTSGALPVLAAPGSLAAASAAPVPGNGTSEGSQ